MKYKTIHLFVLSLLFSSTLFSQKTETIFLSGTDAANTVEWDFYCTDGMNSGEWTKIDVPSNWELEGFGTYNYGHDWKNKDLKLGKEHGLYKYEFEVPAHWKGKTINIVFDGSMTDTKVKINGKTAGAIHQGAFNRFKYDISKLVKYGKTNLLEVDVAKHSGDASVNRAERESDFWIFGGIYRPVFLEALPEIHMNRTAIDAKGDGSFNSLIVFNSWKSEFTIDVDLYDLDGNKIGETVHTKIEKGIAEANVSGKFENVKSWNQEWPTLYNIKFTLKKGNEVLHEVTERIGFRTVELRKHDGYYINNEKVLFKGVCRHSFYPETGRCLSEANLLEDVQLIKEMNMNAVRCSHYVPDKRFLDICDSLGILVLDEVAGWQKGYDTIVGPKLIHETILKDENHPSVVIWDFGNEGGWDFANEKWFYNWDIQKRPVIYPWLLRNGAETHHYPDFNNGIGRNHNGNDPFMATEFMHGLYDGGLGAGLEDFWRTYEATPLLAGAFMWVFTDEAVLRTDKEGTVYDSDGNHAPDGILGPHREKEGSFYTIKEIWSPVQIDPVTINKKWNGRLLLKNKYTYTNLNQCSFTWKLVKTGIGVANEILASEKVVSPDTEPGEMSAVKIDCGDVLQKADLFLFTATDPNGNELYTWSWPVVQPYEKAAELIKLLSSNESKIQLTESGNLVTAAANGVSVSFNKEDGTIQNVKNNNGAVSFTGGFPVGAQAEILETKWVLNSAGNFEFNVSNNGYPSKIKWILNKNGLLYIEATQLKQKMNDVDFVGISFNYPEENCRAVNWMGRGPYRVWKNRIKGSNMGVWEKAYNNTVTGESFNELIYPEFKGYHGNLYWAKLETTESPITIITETPNLFFQLFTPENPKLISGGVAPLFPAGDLSFLYEITAIGTKFQKADVMGPMSEKGMFKSHRGDENYPIKLWFDFRAEE
ncbi:MAG: beta-galactosidase [Bacteroidetes bacterium]|nr:beta-galactosidase [Bacteroidota bacterium]